MDPWNVPHLAAGSAPPNVNPDKVTVYNMRFCPFAQRTILVLLAKKIPFDVVNVNLKKKPEWFLETTWGQVSVVRYQDQYVMESLINSDFIDEQFPENPLHPTDPMEKAKGRLRVEKICKMISPFYKIGEIQPELSMLGTPFFGGDSQHD